jgi:predicted neutral ceramidase superfamily lipid hydrolase
MGWLNLGQRVVLLVAIAVALVALVRFGIHEGSSTTLIPQVPVSVSSQGATSSAVGSVQIVSQPMAEGEQLLLVLGAAILWLVAAVVVVKQPDRYSSPDGDEA